MYNKKAKLSYKHNSFEILEEGDYVICAISGKKIMIKDLNYWNVELQEAYFSPKEVNERYRNLINKILELPSIVRPNPLIRII